MTSLTTSNDADGPQPPSALRVAGDAASSESPSLLDDVPASPASRRLASDAAARATTAIGLVQRLPRGLSRAAFGILLLVIVVLSVGSVRLDSATDDEPAHIVNGVIKLTERWPGFFREQPPLMNSLSAVPVVLAGYRLKMPWKNDNHWEAGRKLLYRSGYNAYRILFLARLPTIALFAALVAVVYWFVLTQTGSAGWALAAAALTGFCPNLMAHGRLATVDLALTFFSFAATALLIRLFEKPSIPIAILFGVLSAAAAMSKISGLILGPYFVVLVIGAYLFRKIAQPRRFFISLAIAMVAALVFFESVGLAETSSQFVREQYPSTPRILVPFAEYLANIRTINAWYEHGHAAPQFFFGEFSQNGWRLYYPVAFLLKTTIPAIVLFIAAIVAGVRQRSFAFLALLAFVILFFAFAAAGKLALGIRYVLPVYPFIYAAIALAMRGANLQRAGMAVVAVLITWHAVENLKTYPSYIAYFNESIGSHRNADKFLVDSNLDWGQDLRRLDMWCEEHHINQITLHYFGGGRPQYELHRPMILMAPGPNLLPKGWFALSRHYYRVTPVDYDAYLAASGAHYVTSIGGSINVYRVDPTH